MRPDAPPPRRLPPRRLPPRRLPPLRPLHRLRTFARDLRGAVSFEAAIIFPVLLWVFVGIFVFFDLFRTANTNAKAAYTIADLLSRQDRPVTQDYLDGLADVYGMLTRSRQPSTLRVSSVDWNPVTETYRLQWSRGTHGGIELSGDDLQDLVDAGRLPVLSVGETIILVETALVYTPAVRIGVPPQRFTHIIPTRPRFVPRLVLDVGTS